MLKQQLNQKLLQKLSPQQIQLMKLIQLPTLAFEQKIKEELENNPALEEGREQSDDISAEDIERDNSTTEENEQIEAEDINVDEYLSDDEIPDYRLQANNYSADDEESKVPITGGKSFHEYLIEQIGTFPLPEQDQLIAEYLVGNIDDDGYIRRDLNAIVDDLAFTQNIMVEEDHLEKILQLIQSLEPAGVGARNLQECLAIQLRQGEGGFHQRLALEIIEDFFESFTRKHYDKLIQKLELDEEDLRLAILEITRLNPKPGNSTSNSNRNVQVVVPDFTLRINDGDLELTLNGRNAPELNVSREYREMLETYRDGQKKDKAQKEAAQFVKQKLDGAKWFIEAIKQRQQTLMLTMGAIMQYQKDYFLSGDETKLRPMILKDIADEIGMDISTVSRVASNKYVNTPYGTFLIKEFFSESMKNDSGEDVSTREIKKILEDFISEEDKRKPLTDEKLAQLLKDKGYPIARRTIAKYREQLDIPVARLRKQI